jgi:hypothetical protein
MCCDGEVHFVIYFVRRCCSVVRIRMLKHTTVFYADPVWVFFYTVCLWVVLLTFRRYFLSSASGSKYLERKSNRNPYKHN